MQLDPAQRVDEIKFWLGQDAEHNLFFMLGLADQQLKQEANALYQAYSTALQNPNEVQGLQTGLLEILPQSEAFKTKLLDTMNAGKWIGWIYPSFVDHAKREMEYLKLRILPGGPNVPGGLSPREELCAINRFNADELGLTAHLLDPVYDFQDNGPFMTARQKGAAAQALAATCYQAPYPQLLANSRMSAADVKKFFADTDVTKIKSIISPILAAHALRERERFLATVNALPASDT